MIFLRLFKTKLEIRTLLRFALSSALLLSAHLSSAEEIKNQESTPKNKKIKILPLVTFYSSLGEGEVYNWWAEDEAIGPMKDFSLKILKSLSVTQHPRWSYSSETELLRSTLPQDFQKSGLTITQMVELAKKRQAALILTGDCKISKSPLIENGFRLALHLEVYRTKNAERAAEVLRIYDLQSFEYEQLLLNPSLAPKSVFANSIEDVHQQLEVFHKRTKNNYVQLIISGNLKYQQLERLKRRMQSSVRGIKSFKQSSFENEQAQFLVDYQGEQELGTLLSRVEFKDFMTQVVSTDQQQVVFDVKAMDEEK